MALFGIRPYDPFRGLVDLQRELDRVFGRPLGFDLGLSGRGVFPQANVFTEKDHAVIRMELPGVPPENLEILGEGRTLIVSGRRAQAAPEGGAYHRRERGSGEFSRSLQLPNEYEPARAAADLQRGVLTIRVPKKEEARPRQIAVNAA